jgi:predicted HAD superfamily Cof-like phosphohydrolase
MPKMTKNERKNLSVIAHEMSMKDFNKHDYYNFEQLCVQQFHKKFEMTIGETPELRDANLRRDLIAEEAIEFINAINDKNFLSAIDALCDLLYVTYGAAVAFGINLHPFFQAVHQANMKKDGGGKRHDGKVLKPKDWKEPDLEGILREQIERYQSTVPVHHSAKIKS